MNEILMWVGVYLVGCVLAWVMIYTDEKYAWMNGQRDGITIIGSIGLSLFSWMSVCGCGLYAIYFHSSNVTVNTPKFIKFINKPVSKIFDDKDAE